MAEQSEQIRHHNFMEQGRGEEVSGVIHPAPPGENKMEIHMLGVNCSSYQASP